MEESHKATKKIEYTPRPNQGQPEKVLIHIAGAKMKSVPFDHKNHEMHTSTCRTCHHEGLNACSDCHTEKGSSKGGGINLAQAYHAISSEHSCIGCHNSEMSEPDCAGCHQSMNRGLNKDTCNICHAGPMGASYCVEAATNTDELIPENLPKVMSIRVLEKDYEPAMFPHADIVKKLVDISNSNKLSRHFHGDPMTVCSGCHHYSPIERTGQVPRCGTCHSQSKKQQGGDVPGLLGAYHRQCLGCHKEMKIKPLDCTGCHAEKTRVQAEARKN